jgi:hypothetical protein
MDGDTLIPVTLCVLFYALVIFLTFVRGEAILNHWAARSGCEILQRNYAWLFAGPFFWTTNRSQMVFRVVVLDQFGTTRKGWVRCGSWWGGILTDAAEARWDE